MQDSCKNVIMTLAHFLMELIKVQTFYDHPKIALKSFGNLSLQYIILTFHTLIDDP